MIIARLLENNYALSFMALDVIFLLFLVVHRRLYVAKAMSLLP